MINEKRLLDFFLEIIQIDSEAKNEKAMTERLAAEAEKIEGVSIRLEDVKEFPNYKSNGKNIILTFPGDLPGDPILLCSHQDTVVPGKGIKPIIEGDTIRTDGSTVLAADDKAGIAEIIEALKVIAENKLPHRYTEVVFTVGEELGLFGAKSLDALKLKARKGYMLDIAGDAGRIINTQPGQYKIFATVHGLSAHAANCPEKGISAILVAAEALTKMPMLRIDEETTANVGRFEAIYPTNIVPEMAKLDIEIRSRSKEKLESGEQTIYNALKETCDKYGAKLDYEKVYLYEAYKHPEDCETIMQYKAAAKRCGVDCWTDASGGAGDGNILNAQGFETVVVSTGDANNHTVRETCSISTMNKCTEILVDLLTH